MTIISHHLATFLVLCVRCSLSRYFRFYRKSLLLFAPFFSNANFYLWPDTFVCLSWIISVIWLVRVFVMCKIEECVWFIHLTEISRPTVYALFFFFCCSCRMLLFIFIKNKVLEGKHCFFFLPDCSFAWLIHSLLQANTECSEKVCTPLGVPLVSFSFLWGRGTSKEESEMNVFSEWIVLSVVALNVTIKQII